MGIQAYEQLLAEQPLSQDEQIVALVNRVGQRIAAAAGKPAYEWEFQVIATNEMHAFALPGGKVAVHEGLLPVCQDEAGLAVVISHEVAHALARHGSERIRRPAVDAGLRGVIQTITRPAADAATTEQIMQVYGAASKSGVMLPYSRKHEAEADAIGLILMAKAGYDPSVAPEFWERFSHHGGSERTRWLSMHPADARRTAQLRTMLPVAMNYYTAALQQHGMGDMLPLPDRFQQSLANIRSDPPEEILVPSAHTSQVSQEGETPPLNEWEAGSEAPQMPLELPVNVFTMVRPEVPHPDSNTPPEESVAPAAQWPQPLSSEPVQAPPVAATVEPASTNHSATTDEETFYPPIAVKKAKGRTSDPFQQPRPVDAAKR